MPTKARERLAELHIGEATLAVDHRSGYTMVSDSDAWAVYETKKSNNGELTPMWSAGVCAGNFGPIRKVNSRVEWYAVNTCYSQPPSAIYQHTLRSTLRESGGFMDWFMDDVETAYAPYSPYSQSLTAFGDNYCEQNYTNNFDQVVRVRVHSVDFGPKVSGTTSLACEAKTR